jgi:hypothetical protein
MSAAFGSNVFFGAPIVRIGVYPSERPYDLSPVEIKQEFINELHENVTIVLRNGLPFQIRGKKGQARRRLTIRYTVVISGDAMHETANVLAQITNKSPMTMRVLKEAYESHSRNYSPNQPIVLKLEYTVTREDLKKYGNSLYHHGLDCWISTVEPPSYAMHPYSEEGMLQATIWNNTPEAVKGGGALYAVEIVDNLGVFGDRYLNIANEVYPVRAKKDANRTDGVYITRTQPSEGELGHGEIVAAHWPFSKQDGAEFDFSQFHLYRTFTDAKTLGDIASARKQELQEKDHELQLGRKELEALKQEAERNKADFDRDKQTQERENQRLQQELLERERRYKELEVERERIKHELELERMRKDTSEIVKILPALILGAAAIITTIISVTRKS